MPPPPPGVQSTPPPPPGFGTGFVPLDGPPNATVVPAGTAGKRSKGKVIGGVIAVVALLGAGGFAVSNIVAGDDGGASSPSDVGTQFMDALASEDVLGVVDLMLPGEREMMRQPLIDFVNHMKRLKVVDESATLDKIGGIDVSFDDVQVDTTATNVDDIADIHITATSTASVDGKTVPIGDLLIDEAFDGERPNLDSEAQTSDIDWNLATVKRDGRWYLSAFYSIAENARQGAGQIPPVGVPLNGSDTPEDAVKTMFDAITDLDLEGLIGSLNPNEAEALQRYAPMFLDDAANSIDDVDPGIQISDMKLSVTGSGDRRSVTIDAFTMKGGTGSDTVTVEKKDDGCITMSHGDEVTNTCDGANSIDSAIAELGLDETGDLKAFVTTVQDAFSDMKPVGITVQKVGGQWYVSPIGTFADVSLAALAALDNQELTAIIDGAKKLAQSFADGLFGDTSLAGSSDSANSDTGSSDSGNSDSGDASGFDKCFGASDYASYSACIAAGVADGSIDETTLLPYDRFAECGVGEQYYSGAVYSMSDEDFTAFAVANAPCFQKYVDDGTISDFELPYELFRPDCLEGKNWYSVTDADYVNRVVTCVTS